MSTFLYSAVIAIVSSILGFIAGMGYMLDISRIAVGG